jgi:hypothetical protein
MHCITESAEGFVAIILFDDFPVVQNYCSTIVFLPMKLINLEQYLI